MKRLFSGITSLALRYSLVTILFVVLILILGGIAATQLNQELIPPIAFPQTIVVAQVTGQTSDQVLNVLTSRLEVALQEQVPELANIESTTASAIGSVIVASNDFGNDQDALVRKIEETVGSVWLPGRQIEAPPGTDPKDFAASLLADLPPEVIVYLAANDGGFLFQLDPEVWRSLSDETALAGLARLVTETDTQQRDALVQLVESVFVPQLRSVSGIADVSVQGGQRLPDDDQVDAQAVPTEAEDGYSRLAQLSPEVLQILLDRFGVDYSDPSGLQRLQNHAIAVPETPPALPGSWQSPGFVNSDDLLEMASLTRSTAGALNSFAATGGIRGALGQTDDLTLEVFSQYLALDPSLVHAFDAEQLSALPLEIRDYLFDTTARSTAPPPAVAEELERFVNSLDGFSLDALSATQLAGLLTGERIEPTPVDLPQAWQVAPPQVITFSFADVPLATFSVFDNGTDVDSPAVSVPESSEAETVVDSSTEIAPDVQALAEAPEGPPLPQLVAVLGQFLGVELTTADQLLDIRPTGAFADMLGAESLGAADFFNTLATLGSLDVDQLAGGSSALDQGDLSEFAGALNECGVGLLDIAGGSFNLAETAISCIGPDVFSFLASQEAGFYDRLQPAVYDYMSRDVYTSLGITPPLGNAWSQLAAQPQFSAAPLRTAADLVALGQGSAASILNQINTGVSAPFAGSEIRLIDGLAPVVVQYLIDREPGFISRLDTDVVLKFSPEVLRSLDARDLSQLPADVQEQVAAIASGDVPSALQAISDRYTTDSVPADPAAPVLNADWQPVAQFLGIELNNAFDLFRFVDVTGTPAEFFNGLLTSQQGAALAPSLLGNLSAEALEYIADEDPGFLAELSPDVLSLLDKEVLQGLPEEILAIAESGKRFRPTARVTRTNGADGVLITIYKDASANTVEAFYAVKAVVDRLDAENTGVSIDIPFEQSSFVEESIAGVVREGSLGAVFATIIILVFLSGGVWLRHSRRVAGMVMAILFGMLLLLLTLTNLSAAQGDLLAAFGLVDVVTRILLLGGLGTGLVVMFWPGELPYPAWRSTLVIGVSIPFSIFAALALMYWLPSLVNQALAPLSSSSGLVAFILRLFPADLTLNIMTLSGLTVAVGRVVDDSIVVLENIFRQLQSGMDKREAILSGARDVSIALFSATTIAVVVFLPLGLTGGLVGEFFLPFGLAVTYALAASFFVAITVVPVLANLFISERDVPEEKESWMERGYLPILRWALSSRSSQFVVVSLAVGSFVLALVLFSSRPFAFIPELGEPQITVDITLPPGTGILETEDLVTAFEGSLRSSENAGEIQTIQSTIGGGGMSLETLFGVGGGVAENQASLTISLEAASEIEALTQIARETAASVFGDDVAVVSAGSISSSGFAGIELVVSGPDQMTLETYDSQILVALGSVAGVTNVTSNLIDTGEGSETIIRVNGQPAIKYSGDLETEDVIGVTDAAVQVLESLSLPEGVTVSRGFTSDLQSDGFQSLFVTMAIAVVIVIVILVIVFKSPVYWIALISSILVAPVGAAIALTLADRVLGISALIGLLMLIGLVITNAVVLLDRVNANRYERGMNVYDALLEGGARRLRPILMTALATIIALVPLAIGLSQGAIIASELGTVVIGGVVSSTLLTLIVVPVLYLLLTPLHDLLMKRSTGKSKPE
jgi:multidrug efflux pump subunit AcrB